MTGAQGGLLVLQGIAFALWVVLSFAALFQIRAIAVQATGSINPGPVWFLRALRHWLGLPAKARHRLLWLVAFGALVALSLLIALSAPAPA